MSKTSESDVILNRANVALSRSQRLVASWLPQTDEPTKTDEELQKEEDEIFTAVPETLGIGAPLPQKAADGSWNRSDLDSNDKLRKQLLGKNYDRVMKAAAEEKAAQKAAKAIPVEKEEKEEEEEYDEEDGRSAMLSKQREKKRKGAPGVHPAVLAAEAAAGTGETDKGPRKGRKKATSYLDELLAERSKKRKKR
ncbi:unnamed protein product [Penicillium salamii]|uniref:Uncharacterized protein n=1 Tax=Penicillium salamii TaxID=1612424 RepID=A0A9W4NVW3_9EURO|nr:unnamed protein product [Penicillium salamii]CAG8390824.1 unnamed protein product [Penicillium salamii]CAG8393958.1 unnamed protein product [Penicillium salamii]CAG8422778.1 unnamed protein product [Penicillium salamii]